MIGPHIGKHATVGGPLSSPPRSQGETKLQSVKSILVVACSALFVASGAQAEPVTQLDLHYKFFLGGARIAKLDLAAEIAAKGYTVHGSGETIGFVANFADLSFSGQTKGALAGADVRPKSHEHRMAQGGKSKRHVVMTYDRKGRPKVKANPAFSYGSKRQAIGPQHTPGTVDPASTFIVPVKAGVSPLHPSQCARAVAIFDGEQRFDVTYAHKASYGNYKLETAGYQGPAIRCKARFRPVAGYYKAGYFPYLARRKDIDVVMAPTADGRYLVPLRVRFPTPLGQAVLQATRYNVTSRERSAALGGN